MKYEKMTKAELIEALKSLSFSKSETAADEEQRLLHDLHVHQIELEMQNRELRETQQKLEESRDRYADLYDFAPLGYVTLDQNGSILEINLTAAMMLGVEPAKLIDRPFASFVVRSDMNKFRHYLQQCRHGDEKVTTEVTLAVKGGETAPVQLQSVAVRKDTRRVILYRTAIIDITERQQAETALEEERASLARRVEERTTELRAANEKLARAARLKDEFLANMSHELRTPLNAILGMNEALHEQVYGPLNEKQRETLGSIDESGSHLLALINNILDLSKIEADKLELEIVPVDLEGACQASVRFISQMALQKRLKVSMTIDSAVTMQAAWGDTPAFVPFQADERQLIQILVNLLSNAVKFTPEGGAIGLEVVGNAEHGAIHFMIWDTGIGIANEDLERLFQPFAQLDSGLSRQYPGTGLGLALVRRLADLHGGSISVESEPGQGSRFTVSLPWQANNLTEGAKAAESMTSGPDRPLPGAITKFAGQKPFIPVSENEFKAARPPTGAERPLILLAEDNESIIRTMSDYLHAKCYRMVIARNGSEAIALTLAEHPAVILMDIQMPGMDGLEATRRIRAESELSRIPIIALTALVMRGDREKSLAAGANDYMCKPINLKKLVEIMNPFASITFTCEGCILFARLVGDLLIGEKLKTLSVLILVSAWHNHYLPEAIALKGSVRLALPSPSSAKVHDRRHGKRRLRGMDFSLPIATAFSFVSKP
jgi:PAS domain S-box-containing protein